MTIGWRSWSWKLGLACWLVIGGAIASWENYAYAQIVPDTTLGSDNSTVTSTGAVDSINGGATRGTNLFHSFGEFNVEEGRAAYFNNPAPIENILTRVTGANPSNILGTLGVAGGNANLFLINPNGIIFGPNARLNVGGSFVGTTANAIGLSNGDFFSANSGESLPNQLLNVNPNALLFNQINAQAIVNRSITRMRGLEVPQGRSLLLMGGDVILKGGRLLAPGGRVELGGVAGNGIIGLNVDNSSLRLNFPENVARANVSLNDGADVNVRAGGGGDIAINAQNLNLAGGSSLRAGIDSGLGSIGSQAGDIEINATETINLINESFIANGVLPGSIGNGGNINILTRSLSATNGSAISNGTFGQGNAGSVNINVRDTVSFDGVSSSGRPSAAFSTVQTEGVGKGGSVNITTGSFFVTGGAGISVSTFGQGNAGSVNINARDVVSFDGVSSIGRYASGVESNVITGAVGNGGSINITTGSLSATNGAQLQASTEGRGDAGSVNINARDTVSFDGVSGIGLSSALFSNVITGAVGNGGSINITAESLSVINGALLSVSTFGQGDAGSVNINARNTVSFDGVDSKGFSSGAFSSVGTGSVGNGGNINITTESLSITNGAGLVSRSRGSGAAGNINITTESLSITNGAGLIASSERSGAAGNLEIAARSTYLDNQAFLSSDTTAGQGNIFLRSEDLVLRRGSNITTNATGTATGGNITINTDILASLEDSDITADAQEAFGGRVRIDTQAIFRTADSDITASSALGTEFSGTVELNTPEADPSRGLVSLPVVPVDTQVVQACTPGGSQTQSEFIVTGRGGLPQNPGESLNTDAVQVDLVTLNSQLAQPSTKAVSTTISTNLTPTPIVEAQGWVIAANGDVILTANAPNVTPHNSWQTTAHCKS